MRGLNGKSSSIDIGEPVLSNMKGSSNKGAINLGLYNDFFWSTSTQGYALNKTSGNQSFGFSSPQYTIFDSGSAQILLPSSMYESFIR